MKLELLEPNLFGWKPIFTGRASRNPTVTDVKFINGTRLIAANRQDSKLYLIDIATGDPKVLHTMDVIFDDKVYHPDLLDVFDNKVYITHFDGNLSVFEIKGDTFERIRLFSIDIDVRLHGIQYYNKHIWCTVSQGKKSIIKVNPETGEHKKYILPRNGNNSIKDIAFLDSAQAIILTANATPDTHVIHYDSYLCLYAFRDNMFHFLDAIQFKNTHFDSVIVHNGTYYATAHSESRTGIIVYGTPSKTKLGSFKIKSVEGFPHGIDILDSKLAYTSYTDSAIYIMNIPS